MDPVTLLVSALVAGSSAALKDSASDVVKDTYKGLKALIVQKFGPQPAVEALERMPTSPSKRASAEEDLVDAARDPAVRDAAREVVSAVERDDPDVGHVVGVSLRNLKSAFVDISGIESAGDGLVVDGADIQGGFSAHGIKAGVGNSANPQKR